MEVKEMNDEIYHLIFSKPQKFVWQTNNKKGKMKNKNQKWMPSWNDYIKKSDVWIVLSDLWIPTCKPQDFYLQKDEWKNRSFNNSCAFSY